VAVVLFLLIFFIVLIFKLLSYFFSKIGAAIVSYSNTLISTVILDICVVSVLPWKNFVYGLSVSRFLLVLEERNRIPVLIVRLNIS
jgi:hypothetical protein